MSRHGKKVRVMMNGNDENRLIGMIRKLENGLAGNHPKSIEDARLIAGLRERIIRTFTTEDYEIFAGELEGRLRCMREKEREHRTNE